MKEEVYKIKNRFGVSIRLCCASCRFVSFGEESGPSGQFRKCKYVADHHTNVRPDDSCKMWQMADRFENLAISKPLGHVKRAAYLQLVCDTMDAEIKNGNTTYISTEDLRKKYMVENKESIYMDNWIEK